MLAANWNIIWHLIENVELCNGQGVNFVEHIQHGDVSSVSFNDIDELVDRNVLANNNRGARYLAFLQNTSANIGVHALGLRDHLLIIDATLLPLDQLDFRGLPVDPIQSQSC